MGCIREYFALKCNAVVLNQPLAMMDNETLGVCLRLMAWDALWGGLPDDMALLAKMVGMGKAKMKRIWPKLEQVFEKNENGEWVFPALREWASMPEVKCYDWRSRRYAVLERDNNTCVYCGADATHVDHVIPRRQGGGHSTRNLVASCQSCNSKKGPNTPEQAGMTINND